MNGNKKRTANISISAMFIALGLVLPFLTGQVPQIGSMLLPMHIPVLLCGLICGAKYGLIVGAMLPLLRSALFGMPPMYPTAVAMAFELATYGFVIGAVYYRKDYRCTKMLFRAMLCSMVAGRLVWAGAMMVLMGIQGSVFTWQAFTAGAFLNAIPGILLQLFLIPAVMIALDKTKVFPFKKTEKKCNDEIN